MTASKDPTPSEKKIERQRYPSKDAGKTSKIIIIGAFIMIAGHWITDRLHEYGQSNQDTVPPTMSARDTATAGKEPITINTPTDTEEMSEAENLQARIKHAQNIISEERVMEELTKVLASWENPSETNDQNTTLSGQKKIVIIIDDMGASKARSKQVIDLPGPLTLAFLPYVKNLAPLTRSAQSQNHELMIHMPMEPLNPDLDLGGIALKDTMSAEDITNNLEKAFKSFDGYVGLNNHMGSRVTQNQEIMGQVMKALNKRDLYFIDSVTIDTSVAAKTAENQGLKFAERDVFLDHEESRAFTLKALERLETIAQERGYAIAIGHPKKHTIDALKEWIPEAKKKGFTLVPASAVVTRSIALTN